MQIRAGCHRAVLLIGPYALKIPLPIGLTSLLRRIFFHLKKGTVRSTFRKYAGTKILGQATELLRAEHSGCEINRQEAAFYRANPHLPLAPVRALLFGGCLLVQDRGTPATEKEIRRWLPSRLASRGVPVDMDIIKADHICRVRGRLCLIDYGNATSRYGMHIIFS